jgi:hypothetical protein
MWLKELVTKMREDEFRRKPLRVHSFLADVPMRTLEIVDLQGGRDGMTLQEISDTVGFGGEVQFEVGPITQALFWLRTMIGRILRWDDAGKLVESASFISRLSDEDRARSQVTPGKPAGISRIMYQFENELLGEIINRTVHCFWVMASERTSNGYALYLAIYVKKLNWFTPIYMALISPVLKWIVYPSMFKGVRQRWQKVFPADTQTETGSKGNLKVKTSERFQ